jgi:hypothetical protein
VPSVRKDKNRARTVFDRISSVRAWHDSIPPPMGGPDPSTAARCLAILFGIIAGRDPARCVPAQPFDRVKQQVKDLLAGFPD